MDVSFAYLMNQIKEKNIDENKVKKLKPFISRYLNQLDILTKQALREDLNKIQFLEVKEVPQVFKELDPSNSIFTWVERNI